MIMNEGPIKTGSAMFRSTWTLARLVFKETISSRGFRIADTRIRFPGSKSKIFGGICAGGLICGAVFVNSTPFGSQILVEKTVVRNEPIIASDGVQLARKITNGVDRSGLKLRLYQYETCPYCSKVRAFLDYYGFSYEVVEVNPVTRKQIKFSKYKKVPVIVMQGVDNKQLNDSSFIMSFLRSYLLSPEPVDRLLSYYPHVVTKDDKGKEVIKCDNKYFVMFLDTIKTEEGILNKKEEREWREWVDGVFVHCISPNVYRTWGESLDTFNWFSHIGNWHINFPTWERYLAIYVGALAMYYLSGRLKKRHNLKMDVRESLYDAAKHWTHGVGKNRKFMGGNTPNLADLNLYGSMCAFEGTDAFRDMLSNTNIGPWFEAVKHAVNTHQGAEELQKNMKMRNK